MYTTDIVPRPDKSKLVMKSRFNTGRRVVKGYFRTDGRDGEGEKAHGAEQVNLHIEVTS